MNLLANSVEQVYGGNVIKQGDETPFGFKFRNEDGSETDLQGSTVLVKIANSSIVVLEKTASIDVNNIITFNLSNEDVTGYGDMRLEFHVTYPDGERELFPADGWQQIKITPTLDNVENGKIAVVTVEAIKAEYQEQIDTFKADVNAAESIRAENENTRISNEDQRILNENQRVTDEGNRQDNETIRESNEAIRQSQESQRQSDTSTAISNAEMATQNATTQADHAKTQGDAALLAKNSAEQATLDANTATTNANNSATYATNQGDYAKAQGDYAKQQGDAAAAVVAGTGYISSSEKGVAGGVAALDATGNVIDASGNVVEGAIISVNGQVGEVNLTATDVGAETPTGSQSKVDTHENNTDIHVTLTEKTTWNSKSDFSGSYNDLTDKPIIPDTSTLATKEELAVHQADDLQHVKYAAATGNANTYAVTFNPAPTAYVEGMAIAFKVPVASTAASTLNVNGLGAKGIKKANGTDVTNLKAGGIYTVRYDGTAFILQGEGASGNATASDLLSGKTATTDAGEITGTMPNRGVFNLGLGVTVPEGYYSGGTTADGKRKATGVIASVKMSSSLTVSLSFIPAMIKYEGIDHNGTKQVVFYAYSELMGAWYGARNSAYGLAINTRPTSNSFVLTNNTYSDYLNVSWTAYE